jgi:uncharacterized membrane protein
MHRFVAVACLLRAARGLAPPPRCRALAVPTMAVTPAMARARIATREEQIGALETELAELRAAVAADRSALRALQAGPAAVPRAFRETAGRSLVKAFGWRVTAGVVTFCSSMYFTKHLATALAIVASDFVSKAGTMFLGERLFNRVKAGRSAAGGESLSRSIAKALIWRAVAFVNTMVVSGAIVGSAGVGSLIAATDSVFKTTLMVGYDQMWNRVDWGKELEGVDGDGI